jgi:hypothetical protein
MGSGWLGAALWNYTRYAMLYRICLNTLFVQSWGAILGHRVGSQFEQTNASVEISGFKLLTESVIDLKH